MQIATQVSSCPMVIVSSDMCELNLQSATNKMRRFSIYLFL